VAAPMVATVANANTAFFMSDASSFTFSFNRQVGHSFLRLPPVKGLSWNLMLMNGLEG
jgi:hypothetical protein